MPPPSRESTFGHPFPVLLLLPFALVYFWGLDAVELSDTDEARSGVIVRDLMAGRFTRLPRTPDGYLAEKPPLYYTAAAGLASLFGLNEWTLRDVSVVFALATLMVVHAAARGWKLTLAPGLAVAALASNALFSSWARQAMVDMTFTFFLAAGWTAYMAGAEGRLGRMKAALLAGTAFGFAVLAKGPLGLVLPILGLSGVVLLSTRGRFWTARDIDWTAFAIGGAAALGMALAWYVPASIAGGREFLETCLLSENLRMPLGEPTGIGVSHRKPLPYYFAVQAACLLPLLALAPLVVRGFRRWPGDPVNRRLLAFFAMGFILLLIAENKRTFYLLPLQPALALLIARCASAGAEEPTLSGWTRAAKVAGSVLIVLGAAVLLFTFFPSLAGKRLASALPASAFALSLLAGCALGLGRVLQEAAARTPAFLCRASLPLALLVATTVGPARAGVEGSMDHTRPFVKEMRDRVPAQHRPAVLSPIRGYALDFYWPGGLLRDDNAAASAPYVFVRRGNEGRLRGAYEELGRWTFSDRDRDVLLLRRLLD